MCVRENKANDKFKPLNIVICLQRNGKLIPKAMQNSSLAEFLKADQKESVISHICVLSYYLINRYPRVHQWLLTSMFSNQNCKFATASSPSAKFHTTTYNALSVKKHWLTVDMLAGPPISQTLNSTESTYLDKEKCSNQTVAVNHKEIIAEV